MLEEEGLKNREKNLVMQKDNRIKVLEDKLKQLEGNHQQQEYKKPVKTEGSGMQRAKGFKP